MQVRTFQGGLLLLLILPFNLFAQCEPGADEPLPVSKQPCTQIETMTIFGVAQTARNVAGGASLIDAGELEEFMTTNVIRALRRVPGASLQVEDGFGLRPNISIRGTPTERSSRITLLEDNVLIAPAPYAAPAAYYFPTFGRINSLEVLKGPAAITQGPYTIGGALNLVSTPIPDRRKGLLMSEAGSDSTWRVHGWYGDANERSAWLLETHQWQSDGFQNIDRSRDNTGLDKEDYLAKFSFNTDPAAPVYQRLEIKLQASEEDSNQTYLGLADTDFRRDPLRRYGLSALDNMQNKHEQLMVRWNIEPDDKTQIILTAYDNRFERKWYKTEGIDFDGSDNAGVFSRSSWASVIEAVNLGLGLGGLSAAGLQDILAGGDTVPGAIQLRNNSRSYESRGIALNFNRKINSGSIAHNFQFGLRIHQDSEDRMQRNDSFQQLNGKLLLTDRGQQGNAGNRLQKARAWSAFAHDRIEAGRWTLTPGIRFESIQQNRIDFGADPADLNGREADDIKRTYSNSEDIWIPGLGALFQLSESTTLVTGVHKGFSAPGNKQGIDSEESINYEAGVRFENGRFEFEALAFFNDYENLQGVCTASSGGNCEIGDVFNGNAVSIPGMEIQLRHDLSRSSSYQLPVLFSYTQMDAEFESDFADSEFFGDVRKGDAVPYIPDRQAFLSIGLEMGDWSSYLSASYTDGVCTQANCGAFEKTDASTILDLGVHYRITPKVELYTVVENLSNELVIAGRQPYGARPGKSRSWLIGARLDF